MTVGDLPSVAEKERRQRAPRVPLLTALSILTVVGLTARLATLPDWIQNEDGYYFVDGVVRYAVPELRPHFPGYPVYIWCGKLFASIAGGPVQGLRWLSVLASVLALWPIAFLAHDWALLIGGDKRRAEGSGLLAALAWLLAPSPWLNGTEIFSDPLGLLLALLALWLAFRALWLTDRPSGCWVLLASALAALMLGVRLAYVSLLLPIVFAVYRQRKSAGLVRRAVLGFALVVGLWLGWQIGKDGFALIGAAQGHLEQHPRSAQLISADHPSFAFRPVRWARTFLIHGLGGWWPGADWIRLPATLAWAFLLIIAAARIARSARSAAGALPWLFVVPYALGVLGFFETEHPRYGLPVVAMAAVLAGLGRPSTPRAGLLASFVLAVAVGGISIPLAVEHQRSAPLPTQLARYMRDEMDPDRSALVLTTSEPALYGMVLRHEAADHVPIVEIDSRQLDQLEQTMRAGGRTVYSTAPSPWAPEEWVPIARFCRSPLIDPRSPVDLWLFRRDPTAARSANPPSCR